MKPSRITTATIIGFPILLVLTGSCTPATKVDPAKADRIQRYFGLRPPYRVIAGARSGFTIMGSFGKEQRFDWDYGPHPIRMTPELRQELAKNNDFTPIDSIPRLLLVGGPRDQRKIPLRSEEEHAAIDLLELAAGETIAPGRLDSLYRALVARPTNENLESQSSLFDESGRRALRAYEIAQGLRRQEQFGYWKSLR